MTKAQFAAPISHVAVHSIAIWVAMSLAACGQNNQYAAPPPPKVTVTAPIERQIPRYFEATGSTAAVNSVDLVARVQGFVQAISYTDGCEERYFAFHHRAATLQAESRRGESIRHRRAGHADASASGV